MPTNKSHHAIQNYLNELQKIISCVATEVCYVYPNSSGRQVLAWSGTGSTNPQPLMLKRKNNEKLFIDSVRSLVAVLTTCVYLCGAVQLHL